ncbi:MAG TPA: hypothetical protein PKN33_19410, partial [Phycisphaerae bacterium]|nr:hypothetical protein [Phycisphaerae bacterium]
MTQPSLFERAQAIFDRVCDAPPEACASILDEACEGDDELRREVESLLAHDASACEAVDAAESGGGVRVLA